MRCTFCSSPAAHPATGYQYGPRTVACRACVESFWAWARSIVNDGRRGGPETGHRLHEAAARFARTGTAREP
jgi:hypothetical protein